MTYQIYCRLPPPRFFLLFPQSSPLTLKPVEAGRVRRKAPELAS